MFKSGNCIIDSYLNVNYADEEFLRFIGGNSHGSVCKWVHSDDTALLSDTVEKLKDGSEKEKNIIIRLYKRDIDYRYVLCSIVKKNEAEYELTVYDIFDMKNEIEEEKTIIEKYRGMMSLTGGVFFEYDVKNDMLTIFWVNGKQNIVLEKGSADEVRKKITEKNYIESNELFSEFIDEIKKGKVRNLELQGSVFTEGKKNEILSTESFKVINGKREYILGIINRFDAATSENKSGSVNDFNKDSLTGLLNKRATIEMAKKALSEAKNNVSMAIIDIDDFKNINDNYGHLFGDDVILKFSEIIKETLKEEDIAGRFGGDEFFVLIKDVKDDIDLRTYLRSIRTKAEKIFSDIDGFKTSCSIGSTTYPVDGKSYEELFKKADKALYAAKEKGKNRYIIYKEAIHGNVIPENDNGKNNIIALNRKKNTDTGLTFLCEMTDKLLKDGKAAVESVLREIGERYDITRIKVYYGRDLKIRHQWGDVYKDADDNCLYLQDDSFSEQKNENDMVFINNIENIEGKYPRIYKKIKNQDVYYIAMGIFEEDEGLECVISYENKEHISNNWSKEQKNVLTVLSRMIKYAVLE